MNSIINAVIRPPRQCNTEPPFGENFTVVNPRGHTLQCTWWEHGPNVCLFLHGNSSSRLAAVDLLPFCPCSLVAFDFSGCGDSDGAYISLGHHEVADVRAVVEYIRQRTQGTVCIWGHSMGASIALMYVETDPSICCVVCDSPFQSLRELARDLRIPCALLTIVRCVVRLRMGFDLLKVRVNAERVFTPTYIMHGEHDTMIPMSHSKNIHDKITVHRHLNIFQGDHTSKRPREVIVDAVEFMCMCVCTPI